MKYAKILDQNTAERDANMVQELFKNSRHTRTEANQKKYEQAEIWFEKKHHAQWQEFATEKERGI